MKKYIKNVPVLKEHIGLGMIEFEGTKYVCLEDLSVVWNKLDDNTDTFEQAFDELNFCLLKLHEE